jgi:hypothetical protein
MAGGYQVPFASRSGRAQYYTHSGKISFLSVAGGLAVAAALVVLLSPLYALLLVYNPSAYLGIILPVFFGGGIGGAIGYAMKKLGSRSAWFAPVLALATAWFAYALSWPFWVAIWVWRGDGQAWIAFWPPSFIELIGNIYHEGVWGLRGGTVSGGFLGFVWFLEACIITVAAPLAGWGVAGTGVYCEQCQRWCMRHGLTMRIDPARAAELAQRLDQRDLQVLTQVRRADPAEHVWAELALDACDGCGATHAVLVEHVTRTFDKHGNEQLAREPCVPHVLVSKEESEWVRAVIQGA